MSNEIYIAKQETLLETKTKVEAVQATVDEIAHKPNSGGGQIVFPSLSNTNFLTVLSQHNMGTTDKFFFISSNYTMSGKSELHVFRYNSNRHYVIIDNVITELEISPRTFMNAASAISTYNGSKFIHFLGGDAYDKVHNIYNVKTRTWSVARALTYSCTKGVAVGERFTQFGANDNVEDTLYFYPPSVGTIYLYKHSNDNYTSLTGGIRNTISADCMIWSRNTAGGSIYIGIFGGTDGTNAYTNGQIVDFSNSYSKTTVNNPFGLDRTYSSFGLLSKFGGSGTSSYYFIINGSSLSSAAIPSIGNLSRYFSFIDKNIVYEVSGSQIYVPLYTYNVYLPKGTKIYSAKYVIDSQSSYYIPDGIPVFPTLKIVGNAYIVEESGTVPYCSLLSNLNLNTCSTGSSSNGVLRAGFHIEIGSGE